MKKLIILLLVSLTTMASAKDFIKIDSKNLIVGGGIVRLTTLQDNVVKAPYNGDINVNVRGTDGLLRPGKQNIDRFYEKDNIDFLVGVSWIKPTKNGNYLVVKPTYYDGYRSDKYNIDPALLLGANYIVNSKDRMTTWNFGANFGTILGGEISESECRDAEFNRRFHCGTGRPAVDVKFKDGTFGKQENFTISWKKKFWSKYAKEKLKNKSVR